MSNDKIDNAEYSALFPIDLEFKTWVDAREKDWVDARKYRDFLKERIAVRTHEQLTEAHELRSRLITTKVFDK